MDNHITAHEKNEKKTINICLHICYTYIRRERETKTEREKE